MMRERKADRQKNHNYVDDSADSGPPIASDLSLEEEVRTTNLSGKDT